MRRHPIESLLLVLCLLALPVADSRAAQLQGVSLSPTEVTTPPGSTFDLDVLVDCGTNADAASVTLRFNTNYLQVQSIVADETSFPNVLRKRIDNTAGTVQYDGGSLACHSEDNCPSGLIRVATVTFVATRRTLPSSPVGIRGQVVWAGETLFDDLGAGTMVTVTSSSPLVYSVSLPLVAR